MRVRAIENGIRGESAVYVCVKVEEAQLRKLIFSRLILS